MDSDIEIIRRTKEKLGYSTLVDVSSMKGSFVDRAVYGYPEPYVFVLGEEERYGVEDRIYGIGQKVFGLPDREKSELIAYQTTSALGIDYAQMTGDGRLEVNPTKMKYLDDGELAYVLGHEAAHLFCKHFQMIGIMKEITKENETLFGLTDSSFITGFSRYLEFEADRFGVALATNAGFSPVAYRTEMGKYSFAFNQDRYGFDTGNDHPTDSERIAYLDGIGVQKQAFDLGYFRKRLQDMEKVWKEGSREDKVMLEAYYYAKVRQMFYRSNRRMSEQLRFLENTSDKERLYQYGRALEYVVPGQEKKLCSDALHRKWLQDELNESYRIIAQAKKVVDERLGMKDKARILGKNIRKRVKEANEWMR